MSLSRFAFTALALSLSLSAHAAPDVSGIEIGSAFTSAKPLMMKANAGYQITDLTQGGKVMGYNAVAMKDGNPVDQLLVLQNESGKVWFIGRGQRLAQGERIKHATLLASLREKYGPESAISLGSNGPHWQFNRAGALYKGDLSTGPCDGMVGGALSLGKVPNANINVPRSFAPTCGVNIDAPMFVDNDGMVFAFTLQLIDAKAMFDELTAKDQAAKADQQRKLEAEQARNVKPKL
jgi:hypothetical protein